MCNNIDNIGTSLPRRRDPIEGETHIFTWLELFADCCNYTHLKCFQMYYALYHLNYFDSTEICLVNISKVRRFVYEKKDTEK